MERQKRKIREMGQKKGDTKQCKGERMEKRRKKEEEVKTEMRRHEMRKIKIKIESTKRENNSETK